MADPSATPATAPAPTKPVKPDQDVFNKEVEKAEKEHKDVMTKLVSLDCSIFLNCLRHRRRHSAGCMHVCSFSYLGYLSAEAQVRAH
jgi:hypothetical protein